jgi:uncharacterized membrane protein
MSLYFAGFILLRLLCLAFAILFVVRLAAGLRARRPDGALALLERRFAAGEIAEEEFRRMRSVLDS